MKIIGVKFVYRFTITASNMKANQKVKDFYGNKGIIIEVRETTALVLFGSSVEFVHLTKLISL